MVVAEGRGMLMAGLFLPCGDGGIQQPNADSATAVFRDSVRQRTETKFPPAPAASTSNRPSHGAGSGISEFLRKRLPSILHMGGGRG